MGCSHSSFHDNLQISVCTTPAFSDEIGGKIELKCSEQVYCDWRKDQNTALLHLSSDRMTAHNVPAGTYEILCRASSGIVQDVRVTVEKIQLVMVDSYTVTDASNDHARDGIIQANISNLSQNGLYKFLWTSGVVTEEPILHDVRPGTYSVNIFSVDRVPIPFYHGCSPATLHVKTEHCLVYPT